MDQKKLYYLLNKEFVRRNAEYKGRYKNIRPKITEGHIRSDFALLWYDNLPNPNKRIDLGKISETKFTKKMTNELNELFEILTGKHSTDSQSLHFEAVIEDVLDTKLKEELEGRLFTIYIPKREYKNSSNNYVTEVNLNQSKKLIYEHFDKLLKDAQKDKKAIKQKNKTTKEDRLRLENWIDYLKVYDLREQKTKYKDIARILWKHSEGDMERKARLYFQKAKNLVREPPLAKNILRIFKN